MPADGRRVNFRDSPPRGGGGSGSSSSRHTSDSGVGSLSDQASRAAKDRSSAGLDVQNQWTDLTALQDAYRVLYESKERWKAKARQLSDDNSQVRKEMKEVDAKWRGVVTRNEELEEDKAKILKDKKHVAEEVGRLQEENQDLRQSLADAHALIEQLRRNSPVMSGANPVPKRRKSTSKRDGDKDQKHRLEKRFDPKESDLKSESTSSSKATRTSRRSSYIEPFGPSAPSRAATEPHGAPRAQYSTYTESAQQPVAFSQTKAPAFSAVPRTIRPHVTLESDFPAYSFEEHHVVEDGAYHPYPLPPDQARGHRGRSSR